MVSTNQKEGNQKCKDKEEMKECEKKRADRMADFQTRTNKRGRRRGGKSPRESRRATHPLERENPKRLMIELSRHGKTNNISQDVELASETTVRSEGRPGGRK